VTAIVMVGIPAHSTYGARLAVDEPQYVLTAMSIGRDGSLDIADELAAEDYRPFHRVDLPRQTVPVGDDGRQVSPHDPLLPTLLAGPVRLGGWVAGRATIAVTAGAVAVLAAWTAMRRFGVRQHVAVGVVAAFSCAAPLATYGTQVYPEVPAAAAVLVAVIAATSAPNVRSAAVLVVAVTALPWLAVKYAPVAVSVVAVAAWRWWRMSPRLVVVTGAVLAAAAGAYLLAHRALYEGWTSYASSGYAAANGELAVAGEAPSVVGRSRRLAGLLVDDPFGLVLWMPAWLLVPVAVGALWRRRPPGCEALLAPLVVGWLVATFVALTMHGWWWPGRQLVVVLPLAVVAVAYAVDAIPALRPVAIAAGAVGVATWTWTTFEAIARRHVLVVDFDRTGNPWVQLWRLLLPDGRTSTAADAALLAAWTCAVAGLGWAGWRYATAADAGGDGAAANSAAIATTAASRLGLRGTKPSSP
jgi:hypothetical protein